MLLLDEPTNDLDFDGLERLERHVTSTDAALVVVSHDRPFLDRTVTRIVEIEPGRGRIREWAGGWSAYSAARDAVRAGAYARFAEAQERRRELAHLLAERRTQARAGGAMADRRGTALLGDLRLDSGVREMGRSTVIGTIAQERLEYGGAALLDAFVSETELPQVDARTLLAKFGLGAEHVGRPWSTLSPGERTRAHLAALQARNVNLLLLDEPTNHLDLGI